MRRGDGIVVRVVMAGRSNVPDPKKRMRYGVW
jgi:hypothetical protein